MMRLISRLPGAALLVTASLAFAQAQPAQKSATQATASAPYSTSTTHIGVLLADPAAKAVLVKHIPQMGETGGSAEMDQASGMSLKELQQAVGQYAGDMFSDKILKEIDQDLAKLPSKK